MKKPIRSASGVSVITLLTKPYPCPGRCIFCPTEAKMPKSYLSLEPAAQRSLLLNFNPFLATILRLFVLKDNGHTVNKAEIIINGGTWSFYPANYRNYFIKGVFIGLNLFTPQTYKKLKQLKKQNTDFTKLINNPKLFKKIFNTTYKRELSKPLELLQKQNTTTYSRAVGISVEERPDTINKQILKQARIYGITKIQIGIQSMNNKILKANRRDHTANDNIKASYLLRANGFKINAHFMPNLYLATRKSDLQSYKDFIDKIQPDEIKIYPTVLFKNTLLYNYYLQKKYTQYSQDTLIKLITDMKLYTPQWVRINRIFRDIPADYMQGTKIKSNLREIIHRYMKENNLSCNCIRCKQIKQLNKPLTHESIEYSQIVYELPIGQNIFIQATAFDKLLGFLRLFLPNKKAYKLQLKPIKTHALIREVHVYSKPVFFGKKENQSVQHLGIGSKLIKIAENISKKNNYKNISVIAGIGTQKYYEKLGYSLIKLNYMSKKL